MEPKLAIAPDCKSLQALWPSEVTVQEIIDTLPLELRPKVVEQLQRVPALAAAGKPMLLMMHLRGALTMLALNLANLVADGSSEPAPSPAPRLLWLYLERHGIVHPHERPLIEAAYEFIEAQEVEAIRADGPAVDLVFAVAVGLLRMLCGRVPRAGVGVRAGLNAAGPSGPQLDGAVVPRPVPQLPGHLGK
jgi:hypothetical protein